MHWGPPWMQYWWIKIEVCCPKPRAVVLVFAQLPPLRILTLLPHWALHQSCPWLLHPQAALPFFVSISRALSLLHHVCWLLNHLCQELVITGLQKSPRFLVPNCAVLPARTRVVKALDTGYLQGIAWKTMSDITDFYDGDDCSSFIQNKLYTQITIIKDSIRVYGKLILLNWLYVILVKC